MLSGESAAGKYPVESVKMMNQIIKFTETYSGGEVGAVPQRAAHPSSLE
jgi:pyruvate kinase